MSERVRRAYWLTMLRLGKERRFVHGNGCAHCWAHRERFCALCRLAEAFRAWLWDDDDEKDGEVLA